MKHGDEYSFREQETGDLMEVTGFLPLSGQLSSHSFAA